MSVGMRLLDRAAACGGVLGLARWRARRGLTILMYHRVLPVAQAGGYALANLVVSRECFEQQVEWLARHARVVTLRQGVEELGGEGVDHRPRVAVTFDDGYADNAMHAAPILEAAGLRGTFFVTTGFIAGRPLWFDVAAEHWRRRRSAASDPRDGTLGSAGSDPEALGGSLDSWLGWLKSMPAADRERVMREAGATAPQPGCEAMSVEHLRALARAGHEIGAHTVTHPILSREPVERIQWELEMAKREIESWIGQRIAGLCYPNGLRSEAIARAAAIAGYEYATTTRRHLNRRTEDRFALGRRWISSDNSAPGGRHSDSAFAAEVLGIHDALRSRLRRPSRAVEVPTARPSRASRAA